MSLKEQLADDLKTAMRARDTVRLSTIRMLQTAITEREKSGQGAASADDLIAIVQKQAKQRRDAMEQYADAGRDDLAKREADELTILEQYLPAQLTDEEIDSVVQDIIAQSGASSIKDIGRVMGAAMQALKGQADGRRVQAAVRALLQG